VSRDFPTEEEYNVFQPDNFWVSSLRNRAEKFEDLAAWMTVGYDDFSSSDWAELASAIDELGVWDDVDKNLTVDEDFSDIDDSEFRDLQNRLNGCQEFWQDAADGLNSWCADLPPYKDLTRSAWADAIAAGRKIAVFNDYLDSEFV
jgi:hypothetical protein